MAGKRNNGRSIGIGGHSDEMPLLNQTPPTREDARLALHKVADGDAAMLDELIAMLGLYVTDKDAEAGYSRIPCVIDGEVRYKHKQDPPPRIKPR